MTAFRAESMSVGRGRVVTGDAAEAVIQEQLSRQSRPVSRGEFYVHGRLTATRDPAIVAAVYEHGMMTREQIQVVCGFPLGTKGAPITTRKRLDKLTDMGVLKRFKPPGWNTQYHYVIGDLGARMIAEERGKTVKELGYKKDAILNPKARGHRMDTNDFFVELARACRLSGEWEFGEWLGGRGCYARFHNLGNGFGESPNVIPDGYAEVTAPGGRVVQVVLELDRGFENTRDLRAKAERYSWLGEEEMIAAFVFPGKLRARNFISGKVRGRVAATTLAEHKTDPLGRVWMVKGRDARARIDEV